MSYVATQQAIAASPFLGVSSLNSGRCYSAALFLAFLGLFAVFGVPLPAVVLGFGSFWWLAFRVWLLFGPKFPNWGYFVPQVEDRDNS